MPFNLTLRLFFFSLWYIHLYERKIVTEIFFSRSRFYSVKYADLLVKLERKNLRAYFHELTEQTATQRCISYGTSIFLSLWQYCPDFFVVEEQEESNHTNRVIYVKFTKWSLTDWLAGWWWCDHVDIVYI